MTPLEIMALIIAVLGLVKLVMILIRPKAWSSVVQKVYANPTMITIGALIGVAVTLYYLLQELSIIQIFAAMLFFTFLFMLGIAPYSSLLQDIIQKLLRDRNAVRKSWVLIAIWAVLLIWVLYAIFA